MNKATEITDASLDDGKVVEPEITLTAEEESRMREMMEANIFYGHAKSKTNPKMRPNIISTKSGIEVIDLIKTAHAIDEAANVIKEKVRKGGAVLFVGTSPASKTFVKDAAVRLSEPYVTERWLGGTLTNFKTILARVSHFKKLGEDRTAGRLQKYTKKERVDIDRELARFEKLLGGIQNLDKIPAVVFIADLGMGDTAAREARRMKTPSIGLVNTNADPDVVDYPIPANDRNSVSVSYIIAAIEKAVLEGRELRKTDDEAKISNK